MEAVAPGDTLSPGLWQFVELPAEGKKRVEWKSATTPERIVALVRPTLFRFR